MFICHKYVEKFCDNIMFAFSDALVWENNTWISDLTSDIMGLYVSDLTTFDFIVWPTELSLIW